MEPSFVHLRAHSDYSLTDGLVRIKPLVAAAAAKGMGAVALTDQSNLFGMVRFYKASLAAGVKPIVGVDAWLRDEQEANNPYRIVLLAQDREGYRNLTVLVSRSYREGQHLGRPMLERAWLEGATGGLIALSGGREGDVGSALLLGHRRQARDLLDGWVRLFGDRYYLELHRTGRQDEEDCLHKSVALAAETGVPVVATNDVRFLAPEDFEAHEVRVCIHEGRTLDDPRRPKGYSSQQYLRSPEEMAELFADIPEALENSVQIAKRCNLELTLGKAVLPDFPVPEGMTVDQLFREQAHKGLQWRLERLLDPAAPDLAERRRAYDERLETELDVIIGMGFPGYFLIVADFIQWAKDNGVPVGPGRGSGAGSLVAYSLKITDLDPLEHDLLFERFLNPERVSMPDFDVDFCMDNRDRVIDYVARTYGRESVSQIITYGTLAARAVVRDVGRVLGHPYGFVDRIAKLVPFEIGMTLDKALAESDDLRETYENDEEVSQLIDMARKLEGLARNAGKHAGGVVIAPGKLTDFTPLYCEPGGENLVTQFDKDDVEQVGLVKFDFLGLRNLTIIDWALQTINAERVGHGEAPIDISRIPMDDPPSFELLKSGRTTAVFQLESAGMKQLIKKLLPDCFGDITALVALFRPGPLQSGMVDDFINRKHGRAAVEYPHPDLEPILKPTYGVILYQEQVMQIAQVLAGYTLGGADLLRRAMGKKKPEEMAKQRKTFMVGATEHGIDTAVASHIFDLMEKFAGYGFNKSHSAAYALVAYQTLWLKAHFPAAYMAAVLSSDMDNTDKVVNFIDECRSMGLEMDPPDVNRSQYKFTVDGERTVVYGLGAIKGVGESAIEGIHAARDQGGPFKDLFEFCRRIDLRKANRRVLETLIRSGALDALGPNRRTLMLQLPFALKMAEQHEQNESTGQTDLFGGGASEPADPDGQLVPESDHEWEERERLQGERDTLGLYLTGHPIDRYRDELTKVVTSHIGALALPEEERRYGGRQRAVVAGLVVGVRHSLAQRGRMGNIALDDGTGRIEATLFSDVYEAHRELLVQDKILVVAGTLAFDEYRGGLSLRADQVLELEKARESYGACLQLSLGAHWLEQRGLIPRVFVDQLAEILTPFRGGPSPVYIRYQVAGAEAELILGETWRVHPNEELQHRLERLLGVGRVSVDYDRRRTARSHVA